MKRLTLIFAVLMLVGLVAGPAFAQSPPTDVEDVGGIGGEQVLPRVIVRDEAPPAITTPAAQTAQQPQPVAQAAPGQLAQTGLELSTGVVLAGALLVLGGGMVLVARRRRSLA